MVWPFGARKARRRSLGCIDAKEATYKLPMLVLIEASSDHRYLVRGPEHVMAAGPVMAEGRLPISPLPPPAMES